MSQKEGSAGAKALGRSEKAKLEQVSRQGVEETGLWENAEASSRGDLKVVLVLRVVLTSIPGSNREPWTGCKQWNYRNNLCSGSPRWRLDDGKISRTARKPDKRVSQPSKR